MALIGKDDRKKVTDTTMPPYSSVVQVYSRWSNGEYLIGSGFVIGESAVVTAAHCVFLPRLGGIAEEILLTPGKNGEEEPFGRTKGTVAYLCPNYAPTPEKGMAEYDWAVVTMAEPLGKKTGQMELHWQKKGFNNGIVYNAGYPSPETTVGQQKERLQFLGSGLVRQTEKLIFKGDWDASAGNSGGPVYSYLPGKGYAVVGILTAGSVPETDGNDYPIAYTTATRLTKEMVELFSRYR